MASIVMDIDSDDIASLSNRMTLDGTAVVTGPSKQTTYVPRYTVPNTALGESFKIYGVEGIVGTEHQLKQVVLTNGSYPYLVNNPGSDIMTTSRQQVIRVEDKCQKRQLTSLSKVWKLDSLSKDYPSPAVAATPSTTSSNTTRESMHSAGISFPDGSIRQRQKPSILHPNRETSSNCTIPSRERELLTFSKECRAKVQMPRYDHDTYIRNQASIRAGTGVTVFSPAEIKLSSCRKESSWKIGECHRVRQID